MINVNQIFQQVATLSRKGQTGDYVGDQFNRQQSLVQSMLFDWYFARYEQNQKVPDSLRPFIKEVNAFASSGVIGLPYDYRHRLEVTVSVTSGSTTTQYECPHLAANEEIATRKSWVRRPSVANGRFYHTLQSSSIKVLPETGNFSVKLKYLANPANAAWGSVINVESDVEDYSAADSTNFEWLPQDEQNLVDLFLYLNGITHRQTELLDWVAKKNAIQIQKV